tara:strand:- start:1605 stop:2291 length:687 start_codon:yes stop_codon:yes gene_type:complete
MNFSAKDVFDLLVNDYSLVGEIGHINFKLKDLSIVVKSKDTIGNLIQDWIKEWMKSQKIFFFQKSNSQAFPDFLLNEHNRKIGLLEVKSFDYDRGPGFDLANFDSYCNSLLTHAYRLDSDYLIIGYKMNEEGQISIENVWLKKIWELACASSTYPLKVQEKKNVIYNIRPSTWYSERSIYKPFNTKEEFLNALNETRYQYPQTRHDNAHWLRKVLDNYQSHTGIRLSL